MIYHITCICNFDLEIEDGDTEKCPDCGRVYDDRGVIIGHEEILKGE